MKTIVRIYALSDPWTGAVRYVGRTVNPLARRLREHIRTALAGKMRDARKETWIKALLALGMKPLIVEIEVVGMHDFQAAEKRWIAHYRDLFDDLLNVNCGGDGGLGGHFVQWTEELDAMLGVKADSAIAKMLGVTRKSVSYRREKLGIPASFDRTFASPPPPMGGHNKRPLPPQIEARFGKEPDYRIADELGIQKSVIARRRRAMGIPSFAASTGNAGTFRVGMPHPRWSKRNGASASSPAD